jgi:proton-dependent oligopeptide transporter, POT family
MAATSKHPAALPYLFLSEMWERFGYYLMIGIFSLYLKDAEQGFGMDEKDSAALYGTFIALVFLTPFIGGLLADRWLGYRKSVIIGGLIMGVGYCLMAIHNLTTLYVAMFLVIMGNGLFKPNISTLLGNLYNNDAYITNKDNGFNIFYMGINVGAFICNFFGAIMYNWKGWPAAFLMAGVGMFIGVVVFVLGYKKYEEGDKIKPAQPNDIPLNKLLLMILGPAIAAAIIGWLIPGNIFGSNDTDAFIFACIPIIFYFFSLYAKAEAQDKRPVAALLAIFAVVVMFWAVFKQNGSALTTWANNYTDRSINEKAAPILNGIRLAQELKYAKDSFKVTDNQFRPIKQNNKVVKDVKYNDYFKNLSASELPQEGGKYKVWNTNLTQSMNPFWVVILTPLVVLLFNSLRRKGKEPSTPTKIALGLLISGLSCLVMVWAVHASGNGATKASPWFLMMSYGVITVGELLLSPMGLSIVSKLSPVRITSLMMGGWFLATSIGNKLSGVLASLWDNYDDKSKYFWVNCALLLMAALACFAMLKWLNKIMKEKGIN